jgi:hypothetical protein
MARSGYDCREIPWLELAAAINLMITPAQIILIKHE